MKWILIAVLSQLLVTAAASAKLEFQLQECVVHSVSITPDKIVFMVSGRCEFLLSTSSAGSTRKGESDLDHATVIIKNQFKGDTPEQRQRSWKEKCDKAAATQGKTIWMDCFKATFVVEEYRVNYVSCAEASISERG